MRSTRATAAIARLNTRSAPEQYFMALTGNGLFVLMKRSEQGPEKISAPLALDDFVRLADATGPQKVRRRTKSDIAFEKQLVPKNLDQDSQD